MKTNTQFVRCIQSTRSVYNSPYFERICEVMNFWNNTNSIELTDEGDYYKSFQSFSKAPYCVDNNLLLFRSEFDYSFDGIILEHIHRQTFHFNLNSKFYGNVSLFQEFNKLFCIMKSRHLFDCSQLIETKSNNKLQSLYKLC